MIMATVVSRLMKCVRAAMNNAGPMQVRVNGGATPMDRRLGLDSQPALAVHAIKRVAMISAVVHLVIGSNGVIRIAVLVPSGSRSGTHGCARIAPQQVPGRWGRVSTRCVANAVRGESRAISLLHLRVRRTAHTICARRNLRIRLG